MSYSARAIEELELIKKKISDRRRYIEGGPYSHEYNGLREAELIIKKRIQKLKTS